MSALIDRAIADAGLDELAQARRGRDFGRVAALAPLLAAADLLVLGALADRIRAEEVGDRVLNERPGSALREQVHRRRQHESGGFRGRRGCQERGK